MGVHLTFVRSVDLDEWTQRQIDAMRIGGNDNAKKFFKKHGVTDFYTKVCVNMFGIFQQWFDFFIYGIYKFWVLPWSYRY